MNSSNLNIKEICRRYLLEEPCANLRKEINELQNDKSTDAAMSLKDRMSTFLSFGTAGIRARMEAGYNRMNRVGIFRLSYALFEALQKDSAANLSVVVGFDVRLNSLDFAQEAANTLSCLGVKVLLFDDYVPTPICAFATKYFQANAGIMITASHNPHFDNGIKLFTTDGSQMHGQILAKIESGIAQAPLRNEFIKIKQVGQANLGHVVSCDEVLSKYFAESRKTSLFDRDDIKRDVPIVYTPLHGVGQKYFSQALSLEGFNRVEVVREQSLPDGRFPDLEYPNPEESGVLDLAYKQAKASNIRWVFANDPDGDRLQVACKNESGEMQKLTGNEMGIILAYFAIKQARSSKVSPLVATSIVSSRMLKSMASALGSCYVESLTGFSNIISAAKISETKTDSILVFSYEESIGYLVGQAVLDKDGINSGARFMEVVGYLEKNGISIWQFLDSLYLQYGLFMGKQWSVRYNNISSLGSKLNNVMSRVRSQSPKKVAQILGYTDCKRYDLLEEQKSEAYFGLCANVIIFEKEGSGRLIVRPSGTEAKIKYYLELSETVPEEKNLEATKLKLSKTLVKQRHAIEELFSIEG